jgi:hypothetical protein
MKLKRYWFSSSEILELGLVQNSSTASDYISQRAYQALRPDMDQVAWNEGFRNKLTNVQLLRANHIRCAPFFGFLSARDGFDKNGQPLTNVGELLKLLERESATDIAVKHVVGGGGFGVWLLSRVPGQTTQKFSLRDGTEVSQEWIDHLLEQNKKDINGYVIEKVVPLHPAVKRITGGGLFSVRLLSIRERSGKIAILGAMARFGRVKGLTDHGTNGGLYAKIDLENGQCAEALDYEQGRKPRFYAVHPDTGQPFESFVLPFLFEMKELTRAAHRCFPGVHFVGWDVIIGDEGPLILEGNVGINVAFTQNVMGGFGPLGVLKAWRDECGCWLPDGSLRWRLVHYFRGRRLSKLEAVVADIHGKFLKMMKLR